MRYGLFFVGLTDDAYFWEILVSNTRKVLFIMCTTLLSSTNSTMKALMGLIIIMVQTQLLTAYRPYIDPRFNAVEYHSQVASVSHYLITFIAADTIRWDIFRLRRSLEEQ